MDSQTPMTDSPISKRPAVVLLRLLLAALLLLGSEILLWTDPPGRSLTDWLLIVPGYLALGALLLDLLTRYRVRDLWGLMVVAGVYGLLNGLLINPDSALVDVPRTLVTRTLGAHTLLGLEMTALFFVLTNGRSRGWRRVLALGSIVIGLAWGVWVSMAPLQTDVHYGAVTFETMLAWGIFGLGVVLALFRLAVARVDGAGLTAEDFRLSLRGMAVVAVVLVALFVVRAAQDTIDTASLIVIPIALALCIGILWFRRSTKFPTYLEKTLPITPLPTGWVALGLLLFGGVAFPAYFLPLIGTTELNQLSVVVFGFTLYGLAWLPTVSLVLGVRAYIRQIQSIKM